VHRIAPSIAIFCLL